MGLTQFSVNCLLAIIIGGFMFGGVQAQNSPVSVFITNVKTDHFVDRLEALGTLKANEAVTLSSSVTETVRAIHFSDGERVIAGTVLVEMTSQEEHAQLKEASSTVAEAKRQYERVEKLTSKSSASESLLDQRRREYETAKARLLAIQSRLDDRLITAPFAGIVGIRELSIGALVEPGDPIITLDDDSVMKLDFSVPSTYLISLHVGMPIVAKARALGEVEYKGEVASINFRIDPVTRTVQVRAILANPEKTLRPGLLMSVTLLKSPRQVIVIPEEAIVAEGHKHFVFTVNLDEQTNKTIANKQAVHLGSRRPGEVEVLDGLSIGEQIVTRGMMGLRTGSEVSVKAVDSGDTALINLLKQQERDD